MNLNRKQMMEKCDKHEIVNKNEDISRIKENALQDESYTTTNIDFPSPNILFSSMCRHILRENSRRWL